MNKSLESRQDELIFHIFNYWGTIDLGDLK